LLLLLLLLRFSCCSGLKMVEDSNHNLYEFERLLGLQFKATNQPPRR
jgi:hypothetical protein